MSEQMAVAAVFFFGQVYLFIADAAIKCRATK